MRSRGARLALAIGLLAVPADAWATPGSGSMTRTVKVGGINIQLTNGGSSPDLAADVVVPDGVSITGVGAVSGASGTCSPNSSQPRVINCFFDPPNGWPGGSTISFDFVTNPPLADNAGAELFTCGIPCDPSMMSGPYGVTGPPPAPAVGEAELEVKLEFQQITVLHPDGGASDYDLVLRRNGSWTQAARVTLTNHGPFPAATPALTVSSDMAPAATRMRAGVRRFPSYTNQECERGTGFGVRPLLCTHDALDPSHTVSVGLDILFEELGAFRIQASAQSPTPDPGQLPNTASISDEIVKAPLSEVGRARASTLNGVARFARAVFVGVAREEGRAKLGEPAADGSTAPAHRMHARASITGCRWLKSRRVRFRRERGRRCDEPVYMRVPVRRGRWAMRLRKPLPPGRYVMMTRAVSSDGLIETAVGPRLGNLKRFRVR